MGIGLICTSHGSIHTSVSSYLCLRLCLQKLSKFQTGFVSRGQRPEVHIEIYWGYWQRFLLWISAYVRWEIKIDKIELFLDCSTKEYIESIWWNISAGVAGVTAETAQCWSGEGRMGENAWHANITDLCCTTLGFGEYWWSFCEEQLLPLWARFKQNRGSVLRLGTLHENRNSTMAMAQQSADNFQGPRFKVHHCRSFRSIHAVTAHHKFVSIFHTVGPCWWWRDGENYLRKTSYHWWIREKICW